MFLWLMALALTSSSSIVAQTLDQYAQLVTPAHVPGTKCTYYTTPNGDNPQGISWACPEGFFCTTPVDKDPCPLGFLCPPNTMQPLYCCAGYYCPNVTTIIRCPKGYYCPVGSTEAFPCNALANCPEGTAAASRFGIGVFFIAFIVATFIAFAMKQRAERMMVERYYRLLALYDSGRRPSVAVKENALPNVHTRSFDLRFSKLSYKLPTNVRILRSVSGHLKSGRLCCILGPSGSGKTTLLNLLMDKVSKTSGEILVNGHKDSLKNYRKLIGMVPQDDVMLRELTLSDVMMHSARARLPRDMPEGEKEMVVLKTIQYLDLEDVMDAVIGDTEKRGLSGGQVKRINVGLELVSLPSILFLDEPTSGLDAANALEIAQLLHRLAHEKGLLVAAVVHAPGKRAFLEYDDLLILGKGGFIVYHGPREEAPAYFARIGFPVPPHVNPADFYVAVASNKVPSQATADFSLEDLQAYWERHLAGEDPLGHSMAGAFYRMAEISDISEGNRFLPTIKQGLKQFGIAFRAVFIELFRYVWDVLQEVFYWLLYMFAKDPQRTTPGFLYIFKLCLRRSFKQVFRTRGQFIYDQFIHMGCGAFISLAARSLDYLGRQPEKVCQLAPLALQPMCRSPFEFIAFIGVFMCVGVYFAGISTAVHTFGSETVHFWRESSAGIPSLPYYVAKVVADIPRAFICALSFSLSFIVFFSYRSNYGAILGIIFFLYLSAFSIGYFISFIFRKTAFGLAGTVFALGWALVFSGLFPDLAVIQDPSSAYKPLAWIWMISAPRYAIEALYLSEVLARPFYEIRSEPLLHAYKIDNFGADLGCMVLIAFGWNVLAFYAMKLVNREKQK